MPVAETVIVAVLELVIVFASAVAVMLALFEPAVLLILNHV